MPDIGAEGVCCIPTAWFLGVGVFCSVLVYYKNKSTIWGHSWEYKQESDWQAMENFCKSLSREKIWRATFGEIYRYLKAVKSLEWAAENTMVRNNSGEIVYIGKDNAIYALKPGEVITFKKDN